MRKFFLILLILPVCVQAQRNFSLKIIPLDKDTSFLTHGFSYRKEFTDTISRNIEMKNLLINLLKEGYLEASYENFQHDTMKLIAGIHIGKQWKWASLKNGNVDEVLLNRIGFREKLYQNKPLGISEVNTLMQSVLDYCENNGYPFASVRLDSFVLNETELAAKIFLSKNKLVTIDSIVIKGDAKISKAYLANYLGFHFPSIYKEDVIQKMSSRLRDLPFLSEAHSPQITFNGEHSTITLFLQKKSASRFDFVLGVLPNSQSTGKLLITGDGQLNLVNPFGKGESLFIQFSQLQSRTTKADVKADYPYLVSLPFGIDGNFSLYKNDTFYLDVKGEVGLKYLFTGLNYLKAFFQNTSTNILTFDSAQIIQTKQLPSYLDSRTNFYGFEYKFEHLDYRFNPSRGWNVLASAQAGIRKVKENAGIAQLVDPGDPSFDFATLYDTLDASENQYIFKAAIDKYWKVSERSILKTSYHGAAILSREILTNELFRVGGFALLRGFDEESIYASQYHIVTAEYHYLLAKNSFFFLFFDGSYVVNESAQPSTYSTPLGFGAGINFETRAGIFEVSYALGKSESSPVEFRSAKIHFGYLNYF